MSKKKEASAHSLPPKDADIVNAVREGTTLTYEQAAGIMHDYRNATHKYRKWRDHADYPVPKHGQNYSRRERLLAVSEYHRGYRDGMEAVIAAMHGYDLRNRVVATYGSIKEGMNHEKV